MIDYEKRARELYDGIQFLDGAAVVAELKSIERSLRAIAAEARREALEDFLGAKFNEMRAQIRRETLEEARQACIDAHASWSLRGNSYQSLTTGFGVISAACSAIRKLAEETKP